MLALHLFGFTLGWTPLRHAYCDHLEPEFSLRFILDVVQHAILPALTIIVATVGGWVLSMRNAMIGVLGTEQITLARAKGLLDDPGFSDRYIQLKLDIEDGAALYGRFVEQVKRGEPLGQDVSMLKIWTMETWQRLTELLIEAGNELVGIRQFQARIQSAIGTSLG